MIDTIDREIIKHLQTDGRMPFAQLGKLIGLSDAATRLRVNRLSERGVINIVAVTDPVMLGLGYQAMLAISVGSDARDLASAIGDYHDVVYVVMTAGRYDLLAEVVCADTETFIELLNTIREIEGIIAVDPMPYLGLTKQTFDWGVSQPSV